MQGMIGAAAIGCLLALPALAEQPNLQGEWKITFPSVPAYVGMAKIDGEGRTIWTNDHGNEDRGYIAHLDSMSVEFVTTGGRTVARVLCLIQSSDLLHCMGRYTDGRAFGGPSVFSRTGRPGPKNLTATSR